MYTYLVPTAQLGSETYDIYGCLDCGPYRACDCTFECQDCLAVTVGRPAHPGGICPE